MDIKKEPAGSYILLEHGYSDSTCQGEADVAVEGVDDGNCYVIQLEDGSYSVPQTSEGSYVLLPDGSWAQIVTSLSDVEGFEEGAIIQNPSIVDMNISDQVGLEQYKNSVAYQAGDHFILQHIDDELVFGEPGKRFLSKEMQDARIDENHSFLFVKSDVGEESAANAENTESDAEEASESLLCNPSTIQVHGGSAVDLVTNYCTKPGLVSVALPVVKSRVDESTTVLATSQMNKTRQLGILFKCKICDEKFACSAERAQHEELAHLADPLLCEICGQSFANQTALRMHTTSIHSDVQPCSICGKICGNKNLLKQHLKLHSTLSHTYKCDLCDRTFSYSSNLSRHRQIHSGEKHHVCEICGKAFHQRSNLQSHLETHETPIDVPPDATRGKYYRPKMFQCDVCQKFFANKAGLKNHEAQHTGHRPHKCDQCDKAFAQLSVLKTHIKSMHSNSQHLCHICGKNYRNEHYLKVHTKTHSGIKDWICSICNKGFVDNPSLKLHMRTHTGEKPYPCKACDKQFAQQAHLKTHMRLHTGEKPYKCEVCGKEFRQISNVLEHARIHNKRT